MQVEGMKKEQGRKLKEEEEDEEDDNDDDSLSLSLLFAPYHLFSLVSSKLLEVCGWSNQNRESFIEL